LEAVAGYRRVMGLSIDIIPETTLILGKEGGSAFADPPSD
jgi:hypothetical protein